jgi:hypothetical protein
MLLPPFPAVNGFIEGYLFRQGEFSSRDRGPLQAEPAPIITTPLAEAAVGTRMLFIGWFTFHLSPVTGFQ